MKTSFTAKNRRKIIQETKINLIYLKNQVGVFKDFFIKMGSLFLLIKKLLRVSLTPAQRNPTIITFARASQNDRGYK